MISATSSLRACLVAAAWITTSAAYPGSLPSAAEIFDHHFAAMGGRPAVEKIESLVIRGDAQEGQQAFHFELSLKAPGLILLAARNDRGLEVRQGRDSQARGWRQYPEGVRLLNDQEAGELMDVVLGLHLPSQLGLRDPLAQMKPTEERDGNRSLLALGPENGKGPFPRLSFDRDTGLLAKVNQVRLDDYRKVGNLTLPFTIRPDAQTVFRVADIQLNIPLTNALFDQPTGKSAAVSHSGPDIPHDYATLISANGRLEIVRRPPVADFGRHPLLELPKHNPKSGAHWQVDLRGTDLTKVDTSSRLLDLLHADFDSKTRWPASLPDGFDPQQIAALGTDPGLGIRTLHTRGITGKGIAVGIIDQTLLVNHVEYADRLRLYEEIHTPTNTPAQMHGPAVASIAVGKTVGVAPEAELYYIAETHGVFRQGGGFDWDFTWLAKSIERLLDVNQSLPPNRRIRVISISVGWSPGQKGFAEAMAATERATREGVFVISTALERTHKVAFHGLGRPALADPNLADSFTPGSWWAQSFWDGSRRFWPGERLLVPMDSRTTASPTGADDYVSYSSGGWSWSVPWIAGCYALACQVQPDITPEQFWKRALQTGKTIRVQHEGTTHEFGTIADPVALMESLDARRTGAR